MRLAGAVIFVRDLRRSQDFYQQVLELEVRVTETDAVLLAGAEGDLLALRALTSAVRVAPAIGVQYVCWTARDREDLGRAKKVLEAWGPVSTRSQDGVDVVEGLDPDRTKLVVTYPTLRKFGGGSLPSRLFGY
jgi:catechol 2,3-dioxygenase-like lactoylglutathione lyase family enzyme